MVWHFLHTYREVIVNALDLLSFILITPEVFRVFANEKTAETLSGIVGVVAVLLIGIYLVSIPVLLAMAWFNFHPEIAALIFLFPLAAFIGAPLIGLIIAFVVFPLIAFERYAFAAGAFIFFISRIIALAVAIHHEGLPQ